MTSKEDKQLQITTKQEKGEINKICNISDRVSQPYSETHHVNITEVIQAVFTGTPCISKNPSSLC